MDDVTNCRIQITHGTTGDPPPKALQMGCYENKVFKVSRFIVTERKLQRNKVFCRLKRNPNDPQKNRLGRGNSLPLTDRHCWQDLRKQLQNVLRSIDKCDLMNKDKVRCIYFG